MQMCIISKSINHLIQLQNIVKNKDKNSSTNQLYDDSKFTGKLSSPAFKPYIELEEFLYLSNKMIINNQASTDASHIKAFIEDEINETELNSVKEEIKYLMFCLLHFYTYVEIAYNKKILNINDEKAKEHFVTLSFISLERAFLTSLNDFDYTLEIYKDRYAKYAHYLEIYEYQDIERSFLECFAAQLAGGFVGTPKSLDTDLTQLLLTARWIFRTYGNSTKLTLSRQNFII